MHYVIYMLYTLQENIPEYMHNPILRGGKDIFYIFQFVAFSGFLL